MCELSLSNKSPKATLPSVHHQWQNKSMRTYPSLHILLLQNRKQPEEEVTLYMLYMHFTKSNKQKQLELNKKFDYKLQKYYHIVNKTQENKTGRLEVKLKNGLALHMLTCSLSKTMNPKLPLCICACPKSVQRPYLRKSSYTFKIAHRPQHQNILKSKSTHYVEQVFFIITTVQHIMFIYVFKIHIL